MVVYHAPFAVRFRRFRQSTHLCSTLQGEAGTDELLVFARRIGLKPQWIQSPGTYKEHFDVFDKKIEALGPAGATLLNRDDFVWLVLKAKRCPAVHPKTSANCQRPKGHKAKHGVRITSYIPTPRG